MSKPVSNDEIEDVLSSIRRLVSENVGAIRRGAEAETAPEKLVLTPAFRVDDTAEEEAPEPEVDDTAEEDDEVIAFDRGRRGAPAEAVAGPAQAEAEAAEAWQDAPASSDPEAAAPAADSRTALERRIAELEAVIARSAVEFEPDGSEDEAIAGAMMFRHGALDVAEEDTETLAVEDLVEETGFSGEADSLAAEGAGAEGEPGEAEAAEEAVLEIEALVPEAEELHSPEAQDWEDVIDEADEDDDEAYGEDDDDEDAYDEVAGEEDPYDVAFEDDSEEETLLDEDTLREMVARMVREELQGNVGERITHNVRRMVRREIARALALQNFE